jgi:sugar lactone lactonase YvrE
MPNASSPASVVRHLSATLFCIALAACGGGSSPSAPVAANVSPGTSTGPSPSTGGGIPIQPGTDWGPPANPTTGNPTPGNPTAGDTIEPSAPSNPQLAAARFNNPYGIAADAEGNLYVADSGNHTIRKIAASGSVTTIAGVSGITGTKDGNGTAARFDTPSGIAVDGSGNVFVADRHNHAIRKIAPDGAVTTFAGSAGQQGYAVGSGTEARFSYPSDLVLDSAGNLYVTDTGGRSLRKINPAGEVTELASPGDVFAHPYGIARDTAGNIYASYGRKYTMYAPRLPYAVGAVIYKVAAGSTQASVVAGHPQGVGASDGAGGDARFNAPRGMAVDAGGNLYVADSSNRAVRKVTPDGQVSTFVGGGEAGNADGAGAAARFAGPAGIAISAQGDLYVTDTLNHTIRKVSADGVVTTFAGKAGVAGSTDTGAVPDEPPQPNAQLAAARFVRPFSVAADSAGNLYVADSGNHTIRKISQGRTVVTIAGTTGVSGSADGNGAAAQFNTPTGIAVDAAGNVYVTDKGNHTVRKITPEGMVTTLAGAAGQTGAIDGIGAAARFSAPTGIASDPQGNLYVADLMNLAIRRISNTGGVTTLTGRPGNNRITDGLLAEATFSGPYGIALDRQGNLYVADYNMEGPQFEENRYFYNALIRKISLSTGTVTTFAGTPGWTSFGYFNGTGSAAAFMSPKGLATDAAGNVYVADATNFAVRKITPDGTVNTLAGMRGLGWQGLGGGADGVRTAAQFSQPSGIAVDANGDLYVADQFNHTIRKVTQSGVVSTFAGQAGEQGSVDVP